MPEPPGETLLPALLVRLPATVPFVAVRKIWLPARVSVLLVRAVTSIVARLEMIKLALLSTEPEPLRRRSVLSEPTIVLRGIGIGSGQRHYAGTFHIQTAIGCNAQSGVMQKRHVNLAPVRLLLSMSVRHRTAR